jgi:hypothetical protein
LTQPGPAGPTSRTNRRSASSSPAFSSGRLPVRTGPAPMSAWPFQRRVSRRRAAARSSAR